MLQAHFGLEASSTVSMTKRLRSMILSAMGCAENIPSTVISSARMIQLPAPGDTIFMIRLPRSFYLQIGLLTSLLLALPLPACSPPVQVDRVDLRSAYDEMNRTALSSDQLSEVSRTVLRRAALLD